MANTFSPFGFRQFQKREGTSPTYGLVQVWIGSSDTSVIFTGDPVITSSAGGANGSGNYVTGFSSGLSLIRGIFQGCEQFQPSVGRMVWAPNFAGSVSGSTGDIKAWIVDDPDMQWIVQGSTNTTIASSFIGLNAGFTLTSSQGNTTTGVSAVALNTTIASTTIGSSSLLPFRILDFYSNWAPPGGFVNGTDNTVPGAIVVVTANNWDRNQLTARSS